MLPENIDDLFRDKLDGHETPPDDALWARLQAQPNAGPGIDTPNPEHLDQLFRTRLSSHATPPARALWERLEDEHLRPRKRRPAAWWPLALAAAVALLLTAGGAGLWLALPTKNMTGPSVASQAGQHAGPTTLKQPRNKSNNQPVTDNATATPAATIPAARATIAANASAATPETAISAPVQKNTVARATRPEALASTASKARKFAERQSPRHPLGSTRQPDAAAASPSLVARTTVPLAPAPARIPAADEPRLNPAPALVMAQASTPTPMAEIVPAGTVIVVDVRNGNTPAARSIRRAFSDVASANAETGERRGLGGRLLQQVGHLVRGERLSLAEATGLPENLTLRANIGGHTVSKSIQL